MIFRSLISLSVGRKSPFSLVLSSPSPEILDSTYTATSPSASIGNSYSPSIMTLPIASLMTLIRCSLADLLITLMKSSFIRFLIRSYSFSHLVLVISKPHCLSPSSQLIKKREFTSPEPVPPLMVCLAPLPYNAILQGPSKGKSPFFFNKTRHSPICS